MNSQHLLLIEFADILVRYGLECVLDSSSHSSLELLMEKIEGGPQGAI